MFDVAEMKICLCLCSKLLNIRNNEHLAFQSFCHTFSNMFARVEGDSNKKYVKGNQVMK